MGPSKDSIRFYIFTHMQLGNRAVEIHANWASVFADSAPSFDTVARWMLHFADGRSSVHDEKRSGIKDLARAVKSELERLRASEYFNCLQTWQKQMQLCIEAEGMYFEGMRH